MSRGRKSVKRICRRRDHLYMRPKLNCLFCVLVLALPASAQLDTAQLRVKFGAPLNREIFRIPPGFDLVVDYGAGNQVCTLRVPALMPTDATVRRADDMKQKMQAFLADLVPDSMRGKSRGRMFSQSGAFSGMSFDEYEHVTIVETLSGTNDTITVRFNDAGCRQTEPTAR
jgi:hypothetical protein